MASEIDYVCTHIIERSGRDLDVLLFEALNLARDNHLAELQRLFARCHTRLLKAGLLTELAQLGHTDALYVIYRMCNARDTIQSLSAPALSRRQRQEPASAVEWNALL